MCVCVWCMHAIRLIRLDRNPVSPLAAEPLAHHAQVLLTQGHTTKRRHTLAPHQILGHFSFWQTVENLPYLQIRRPIVTHAIAIVSTVPRLCIGRCSSRDLLCLGR